MFKAPNYPKAPKIKKPKVPKTPESLKIPKAPRPLLIRIDQNYSELIRTDQN